MVPFRTYITRTKNGISASARVFTDRRLRDPSPPMRTQGLSDAPLSSGDRWSGCSAAFVGPHAADDAVGTPQPVKDFIRGYEAAGCDELVLLPTVADIEEVDRLAEVIGG
jgi:hypothetical protein